jgi:hypothetical protein
MGVLPDNVWRLAVLAIVLSLAGLSTSADCLPANQPAGHVPAVADLVQLLQARPDLRAALEGAIQTADLKDIANTEAFLHLLDNLIAEVPNQAAVLKTRECY